MAKRFTDTDKWKKEFLKSLPSAYKIFWLYLCDECSNIGIWETSEVDVACLRTGETFKLKRALELFNKGEHRVHEFDGGKKWFIPGFVTFQYGDDFAIKASKNRLIDQAINHLTRLDLLKLIPVRYPLERVARQEQDKDMDKVKDKDKKRPVGGEVWDCPICRENGKEVEVPLWGKAQHLKAHDREKERAAVNR